MARTLHTSLTHVVVVVLNYVLPDSFADCRGSSELNVSQERNVGESISRLCARSREESLD